MDELVYVMAAPFKQSGVTSIPIKDFDYPLSFDSNGSPTGRHTFGI
jgi:hypothetical protein